MTCPFCRNPLPDDVGRFCATCGADLRAGGQATPGEGPAPQPGPPAVEPPGPPAAPTATGGTPWEQRERLGLATAFLDTTREVLFRTTPFFRAMPTEGGLGAPLAYGVLAGYLGLLAATFYELILSVALHGHSLFSGNSPLERALANLQPGGIGTAVLRVVLGPLFLVVGLFLTAGLYHLGLLLVGGAKRGFEATLRVVCYSQAAQLLLVLPFCGGLLALWSLVIALIGLSEAHRIHTERSALGMALVLLVLCCCGAAILLLLAAAVGSLGLAALGGR